METDKPHLKKLTPISASRIKTFENCSWLYWGNYHLKLPQIQNDGAKKGEVCHNIFELLLNKKHKHNFDQIIKLDSVSGSKSVERLIKTYLKKLALPTDLTTFIQIDKMILVGLKTDFFVKDGTLVAPEFKFDIYNEEPKYHLKGFMDKPYLRGHEVIIDDFKSSKKKFEGEDEESNLQALFYSLAAKKLWPDLEPKVRFIFLQFPEDPLMEVKFTSEALKGFEYYLDMMQNKVMNFSEAEATKNFAADMIVKGNEFKGKLLCGFASHPKEKKKDGTKKWHCPYKFPFDYFIVRKESGEIAYTAFEKPTVLKPGEKIESAKYEGCPRFKSVLDNFTPDSSKNKSQPKVVQNVLDDF